MSKSTSRRILALAGLLAAACGRGPLAPAELDARHESCRFCRMAVSQRVFAAQIVAPGEEPLFFDDLGCLRDYLAAGGRVAEGGTAFVADRRTGDWIPARRAVYSQVPGLDTPMGSHLVAHADVASRDADAAATGAAPVSVESIFGPGGAPGER